MTGFPMLARTESLLLLRDPGALFTMIIPIFILVIFGTGSASDDPLLPAMTMTISVGLVGLYMVPTTLATYRERGILRRMSTTPVSPSALLGVQLTLQLIVAVLTSALLVVVWTVGYGANPPAGPLSLLVALSAGTAGMFAIGLLIAALAPNGRTANGIGVLLYFPLAFIGGLMQPKHLMPELLATIGDFTPMGALRQAIQDAWAGAPTQPMLIGIMLGYAVVAGALAARFFRWE